MTRSGCDEEVGQSFEHGHGRAIDHAVGNDTGQIVGRILASVCHQLT